MPLTRNGTERPREPSLQLYIDSGQTMCRIAGRLRGGSARIRGADVEIPAFVCLGSNTMVVVDSVWWVV